MKEVFSFQILEPQQKGSFSEQLQSLKIALRELMQQQGLTPAHLVFTRVYLTDAANQWEELCMHPLYTCYLSVGAVSRIEQPLLDGSKVALQLWFVTSNDIVKSGTPECMEITTPRYSMIFHSVRFSECEAAGKNGNVQTCEAFERHIHLLESRGMNLKDHCHRTWLYVRDIDRHYADVVEGRNAVFAQQGLTPETHFIASTGIGGVCYNREAVVAVDFLSIRSNEQDDVYYLKALDYLNPTHEYGVAFERGTRIALDSDYLYFISGTASIDKRGLCVHHGDVLTQTGRLFLNIEKLLNDGGATLSDMAYMIVYLRDVSDYAAVSRYLRVRFPNVPMLVTEARVCRPEWLIEVECIARCPR